MTDKYLLNHIKDLENELNDLKQKEIKLQKIVLNLKKLCQPILNVNLMSRDINTKIGKYLNTLINNLDVDNHSTLFHDNGYIQKEKFFELVQKFDFKENLLFIFKLKDSNELEFVSSFIESKFATFLFIDVNKVVGIIKKKDLKEFEKTKFIPFFKDGKYEELKFFVIFFEVQMLDNLAYKKASNLFDRFYLKPSMNDKSFVHYSLNEDKIIDFELIEKEKIKKEFAYINELKYPEIETLIRKEIKNSRFILALLDRIDNEIKEIKNSKGTIIVVKRILSFIHKYQLDKQIQQMTELISQELEKENFIQGK